MVSEKEMIPVRIKFSKTGDLMYISHLDLSRTMQRIILRAGIDIWYSEGFNPQPKMVFALPLPIGVESVCEYLDIRLNTPMDFEEIKERIQSNFPSEMKVLDVYSPSVKFKLVAYADYTIRLYSPALSEKIVDDIKALFSKECIITKKTKSGEKEVDICEYIKSLDVKYNNDFIEISAVLSADGEKNLNPEFVVGAIKRYIGILNSNTIDEYHTIMRNRLLDSELNEFK